MLIDFILYSVIGAGVIFLLTRFLVNVGSDEIAITEQRYIGASLEAGRVFAMENQVGLKAEYKSPGLHFVLWPIISVVSKPAFLTIAADELGIVEATDGAPLSAGRIFADDPAGNVHNNFQNPVEFLKGGGIRGSSCAS